VHCFLLKGVYNKDHVYDEVKTMVADLQLGDKASIQASRLSGGMKRKLRYNNYYLKLINSHVLCVLQCCDSSDWWFKSCHS
jgi:hypothetical protein